MLLMLLVPPLDTGITWSAVSFFFFPQHRHKCLHFLHNAFHSVAEKEPPALVLAVLCLWSLAFSLSGLALHHFVRCSLALSGLSSSHLRFVTEARSGLS